jgi:hypothetical protein
MLGNFTQTARLYRKLLDYGSHVIFGVSLRTRKFWAQLILSAWDFRRTATSNRLGRHPFQVYSVAILRKNKNKTYNINESRVWRIYTYPNIRSIHSCMVS